MISKFKNAAITVLRFIGLVIAWVASFLFYFLILGPYAIVMRVAFGDLLEQSPDSKQPSYWHRLDPKRPRPKKPF